MIFHFSVTLRLSKFTEKDYDENLIYLLGQYLPQPDGGVRDEGLGRRRQGLLRRVSYRIGGDHAARRSAIPVYPPARRKLAEHGISCEGHAARQLTAQDYEEYDLLIGMEGANLKNMQRICGGDPAGKMHRLLDYTDRPGDVADPWYTGDFEATWRDVSEGCKCLLAEIEKSGI